MLLGSSPNFLVVNKNARHQDSRGPGFEDSSEIQKTGNLKVNKGEANILGNKGKSTLSMRYIKS